MSYQLPQKLLRYLSKEEIDSFVENIQIQNSPEVIVSILSQETRNPPWFISSGFSWTESIEGFKHWSRIHTHVTLEYLKERDQKSNPTTQDAL